MSLPHRLSDPVVELVARRFRVLGEPMRIRLLDQLRGGDATVQKLADALGASQQNVSKHLGILLDAGIVARRKEGTAAIYSIADETVYALCENVCDTLQRQFAGLANLVGGNLE